MAEELPEVESKTAVRLNVTVRHQTKSRLDEVRNKRRIDVNVSQICDSAINAELDRLDKPGIADVVARLQVERDRRRGAPYREGFLEGERWARTTGSWGEICWYARLSEDDVQVDDVYVDVRHVLSFVGRFYAPEEDYQAAPVVKSEQEDHEGRPVFSHDPYFCEHFWRGWWAGVIDLYNAVSEDLEPIDPVAPAGAPAVSAEPSARHVDPDDIPF